MDQGEDEKADWAGALEIVRAYHALSKHAPERFAPSPESLDWSSQPDPFRSYEGAPTVPLPRRFDESLPNPGYHAALSSPLPPPQPLNAVSLGAFFYHSLALSAWKGQGAARRALRVNPSSGNLHPAEGYLIADAVPGLRLRAGVSHYAPRTHALEQRCEFDETERSLLRRIAPPGFFLAALASVPWREAWKYGERAFRYCQLDVGHALGALAFAGLFLGWKACLLPRAGESVLRPLLHLPQEPEAEVEIPECLVLVGPESLPRGLSEAESALEELARRLARKPFRGRANRLSPARREWPMLRRVFAATAAPCAPAAGEEAAAAPLAGRFHGELPQADPPLRTLIRRRRSAAAMDGESAANLAWLARALRRLLPGAVPAFDGLFPWPERISCALFAHRITGLEPGLYLAPRSRTHAESLRRAMDPAFVWKPALPDSRSAPLVRLAAGDFRRAAAWLSCFQAIASDGALALCMLADLSGTLDRFGPGCYRALYWEAGFLGQVLYLEAESAGLRGVGIGCFFDDAARRALGLAAGSWEDLYHFAVGGAAKVPGRKPN
ncbi:MAG: hypothetical protein J7M29_11330, partial [Verrucomicrobia bacterium]|nr:hypothetical protein [Verrucomicrobiota bacterium]